MNRINKYRAFSLMELMIVIAIIGILVAVAVPSYKNYTIRAHYAEIVQAAAPYKLGVETCYQLTGSLEQCRAGEHSIPPATLARSEGLIQSIEVNANGTITVTPNAKYGITAADTYILVPTAHEQTLTWRREGGGVQAGYA